jgi:predicted O-methyltransferase YrrM
MISSKAAKAGSNIEEADLADFGEIREGNALDTLRNLDGPADFLLRDGFESGSLILAGELSVRVAGPSAV